MKEKDLVNLIFEWSHLRRIRHEGYALLGDNNPESVAEHNIHMAQIGYVLAKMEGYDKPDEVVTLCVFHEIGETRIGDVHRIADNYVKKEEKKAVIDQLHGFDFGRELLTFWEQVENRSSNAGHIAKDADILQSCFYARELECKGYNIGKWLDNARKYLKTESAKKLLDELKSTSHIEWFEGLKTFKRLQKFD